MQSSSWMVLGRPFRIFTITGAGLWWMLALVQFMPIEQTAVNNGSTLIVPLSYNIEFWIIWIVAVLLLCIFNRLFSHQANRFWLACVLLVFLSVSLVVTFTVFLGVFKDDLLYYLVTTLYTLSYTILLFLWGVRFALLDVEDAGPTVFNTAGLAFFLLFVILLIPPTVLVFVKHAAILLSTILFMIENRSTNSWHERKDEVGTSRQVTDVAQQAASSSQPAATTSQQNEATSQQNETTSQQPALLLPQIKASFYVSRLAYGVGISTCVYFIPYFREQAQLLSTAASILLAAVLLIGFLLLLKKNVLRIALLPLLPVITILLAATVFFPAGVISLVLSASAIVWFSWISLSSLQLSAIREQQNVDIVQLACVEKFLIIAPLCLMGIIQLILPGSLQIANPALMLRLQAAIVVIVLLAVIGAVYVLIGVIPQAVDKTFDLETNVFVIYDQACASVAERFDMTARECEVMAFLGRGYTRAAISEKLVIADGTTRTHIRNIHQKMMIHKNDELIDILYSEMAGLL